MAFSSYHDSIVDDLKEIFEEYSQMEDKLEWIYANFTTIENETKWREFEEEFDCKVLCPQSKKSKGKQQTTTTEERLKAAGFEDVSEDQRACNRLCNELYGDKK